MYWNDDADWGRWKTDSRLTLTWDVLKFNGGIRNDGRGQININMRCIEMYIAMGFSMSVIRLTLTWDVLKLERSRGKFFKTGWLTLTWDVLKSILTRQKKPSCIWLTLTWDVLKFAKITAKTAATAD